MWKFVGCGAWLNEELKRSVNLNEDYGRTFTAAAGVRPQGYWPGNRFCNAAGNVIRFRSLEAAIRYAEKH